MAEVEKKQATVADEGHHKTNPISKKLQKILDSKLETDQVWRKTHTQYRQRAAALLILMIHINNSSTKSKTKMFLLT